MDGWLKHVGFLRKGFYSFDVMMLKDIWNIMW